MENKIKIGVLIAALATTSLILSKCPWDPRYGRSFWDPRDKQNDEMMRSPWDPRYKQKHTVENK